MSNVKAGDLAIIVGSKSSAGVIVEVLHRAPFEGEPDTLAWEVKCQRPFPVTIAHMGKLVCECMDTVAVCRDSWLRPVSGIPDVERDVEGVSA